MADLKSSTTRIPFSTSIAAVTVYPDQARVTRRGTLDLAPAAYLLVVSPLPSALQLDGVQTRCTGSAQVTLQRPVVEPIAPPPIATASHEHALHAVEDEFRHAKDTIAGLNLQRTFLESLLEQVSPTFARGLADQSLSLEAVTQFLTFFEETYQQVSREIVVQERLKHTVDGKLQALRQVILNSQSKQIPRQYEILLPIQVHTPGTVELEVVYSVDQAQWHPVYEIRVDRDPTLVKIDCIAEIQQRTGEDWLDVAIAVSTAVPEKTPAIPNAPLWQVQPAPPEAGTSMPTKRTRIKARSHVLDDAYRMLGAIPGSEIPDSDPPEDSLSLSLMKLVGTTIQFVGTGLTSVPTNGLLQAVAVGQLEFTSDLTYIAISQRYSAPYLLARLSNPPDGVPLLPGKAYLFRAGGYLGEEELDYVAPGSSFEVSLGLDDRLSVQRQLVGKEAIATDPCQKLRALRLSIHNPFDYPVVMDVLEQIPTSCADNVHVTLAQAEPTPVVDPAGICQWSLTLAPQETQEIYYEYVVEHPCDVPILGLDG